MVADRQIARSPDLGSVATTLAGGQVRAETSVSAVSTAVRLVWACSPAVVVQSPFPLECQLLKLGLAAPKQGEELKSF